MTTEAGKVMEEVVQLRAQLSHQAASPALEAQPPSVVTVSTRPPAQATTPSPLAQAAPPPAQGARSPRRWPGRWSAPGVLSLPGLLPRAAGAYPGRGLGNNFTTQPFLPRAAILAWGFHFDASNPTLINVRFVSDSCVKVCD